MRALLAVAVLTSPLAFAESPWLSARGRVADDLRIEGWGGPGSVGVGVSSTLPDWSGPLVLEAGWSFVDRMLELRGARVWQLTRPRFATLSFAAAGATFLVPGTELDFGMGPHAQLSLSLGGNLFTVDLALHTGVEVFVRGGGPRFPQRVSLGATLHLGPLAIFLMGRLGVDLTPGHAFVFRGEAVLGLGWWRASTG